MTPAERQKVLATVTAGLLFIVERQFANADPVASAEIGRQVLAGTMRLRIDLEVGGDLTAASVALVHVATGHVAVVCKDELPTPWPVEFAGRSGQPTH